MNEKPEAVEVEGRPGKESGGAVGVLVLVMMGEEEKKFGTLFGSLGLLLGVGVLVDAGPSGMVVGSPEVVDGAGANKDADGVGALGGSTDAGFENENGSDEMGGSFASLVSWTGFGVCGRG